ncbi:MAG: hypothetical protein DSZ00_05855 [Gammaproteobacteria bacterium]|nr:MAG: hypothetical protein DSZ00_05855 [Gammaproteobacteria bacterium]
MEQRMKFQFSYRKIDKKEKQALRELVDKELSTLEEILGSLDSEATQLEGAIERHGNKELYRARLKLHLPGKTLAALEESHESNAVIREVFAEIRRQVKRFKHLSKNDYLWKRPRRRAELRNLLKEQAAKGGDRPAQGVHRPDSAPPARALQLYPPGAGLPPGPRRPCALRCRRGRDSRCHHRSRLRGIRSATRAAGGLSLAQQAGARVDPASESSIS